MTHRKIGRVLIIAGSAVFLLLVAAIILRDIHMWQNDIDGFTQKYASVLDLIYSREKGALLISAAAGLFPALVGNLFCRGKPEE